MADGKIDFSNKNMVCSIIGLGLIGGSIAKAIHKFHPDITIHAYNRSPQNTGLAMEENVIQYIMKDVTDGISESDCIFLCSPVGINVSNLVQMKPHLKKGCIITDVGSVKGDIHKEIIKLGLTEYFIGGHPMAGSEKTGYQFSSAELLENAYYILTPGENISKEKYDFFFDFIASLHALPIASDYRKHDHATAAISHVPHLIAATLVELVEQNDSEDHFMKMIAAGGFKDITRIASSSPTMWEHICRSNCDEINALLSKYIEQLESIHTSIENNDFDAIYKLFEVAGAYRNSINDHTSGPIHVSHKLYLDLPDKAGAIATVATILAKHQINIKNIGITHNREHVNGVLYIEFYDEKSMKTAIPILSGNEYQYTIYIN